MSKAKKVKKSILSDRAKENLRLGFSSLFNNEPVVTLAHTRPWYGAVIVGLLSLILTIIPTFVSNMQTSGGDILSSPNYGYDVGLMHFQEDVQSYEDGDASKKIFSYDSQAEKLSVNQNNWGEFLVNYSQAKDYYLYNNEKIKFGVYYKDVDKAGLTTYATEIYNEDNPSSSVCIGFNKLILGNESFCFYKYNAATTPSLAAGSYSIEWLYKSELPVYEAVAPKKEEGESDIAYADAYAQYQENTISNWKAFLTKAYENYKIRVAWIQTGIMAGIYAGFILLMGLVFFLMSRGKNNVARIYTFWECMKMSFWGADCPAILACVFGFWLSGSLFTYSFIFLFGMRAVWLSMKYMRPAVQGK